MRDKPTSKVPLKIHGRPVTGVYTLPQWLTSVQNDLEELFSEKFVVLEENCRGSSSIARLLDAGLIGSILIDHESGLDALVTLRRPGGRDQMKLVYRLLPNPLETYLHGVSLECRDPEASFDLNLLSNSWPFSHLPGVPSPDDELKLARQQAMSHIRSCFPCCEPEGPNTDSAS